jgi:hypothetical protein
MSYVVYDTQIGIELVRAESRAAAIGALRAQGLNAYAAVRLLDVADGLRPDDGVPRPVSVVKED